MAGTKEIRNKIKSVQNTRKITKAMEMVAASKMRKAQERMRAARPYAKQVSNISVNLSKAHPEYQPKYFTNREVKNVGVILITSDKGLCGGLNTNSLRMLVQSMKEWSSKGIGVKFSAVGSKGLQFLNRTKANVVSHVTHLGDKPRYDDLLGTIKVQLDAFENGDIDCLYLVYNQFINTMRQEPILDQVLPMSTQLMQTEGAGSGGPAMDYIYEPDPQTVIDDLIKRYIESLIYKGVCENIASEQSARMVAMKAASDNAKNVIGELQLVYNKTRQAAITKELSEIVGGAAAV